MKSDDTAVGLHVLEKPLAFPHPSPGTPSSVYLCELFSLRHLGGACLPCRGSVGL